MTAGFETFGNPEQFALEVKIWENGKSCIIGSLRIWLNGVQILAQADHIDLTIAMSDLTTCLALDQQRVFRQLLKFTPDQIGQSLLLIYREDIPPHVTVLQERVPSSVVHRMIVSAYNNEGLDDVFMCIFRDGRGGERVVWHTVSCGDEFHELNVPCGVIEKCVLEALQFLSRESGALRRQLKWLAAGESRRSLARHAAYLRVGEDSVIYSDDAELLAFESIVENEQRGESVP